jgi:hypothetical protein
VSDVNYALVLGAIRPGSEWSLSGNDYATLVWHSDTPKPTKKTLDDAWPDVQRQLAIDAVRAERAAIYREETDGIFFQAMREEGDVTLDDWKAAVQAVKDNHPWPA